MKIIFSILFFLNFYTTLSFAQLPEATTNILLNNAAIKEGHLGVSIYNMSSKTYLYNYNADKYFTPASNQKIFTLYAGLSTLGDSLTTAKLYRTKEKLFLLPMGDPSFLNPEFTTQPLLEFLKKEKQPIVITNGHWQDTPMGKGWMWDDYADEFSAERTAFPIYGNAVTVSGNENNFKVVPSFFKPEIRWESKPFYSEDSYSLQRNLNENVFYIPQKTVNDAKFPFLTFDGLTNAALLGDTLHRSVALSAANFPVVSSDSTVLVIRSIRSKALFKPMMERSDNFYAEQTLQMSAMQSLGKMNTSAFIKKFTAEKLATIPQPVQWVDGSGLSRYNLCTPQSLLFVLEKIHDDFGMSTVKELFTTGGEGTIKNYYTSIAGSIYAKTGTLSDNSAFSGYLITKNKTVLGFSIMVNNYQKGGRAIRLAIQEFLLKVWETQ